MQSTIKSTLGPYGGDLLLVDANGRQTITNDGATVMKVRLKMIEAARNSNGTDDVGSFLILSILPPEYLRILLDLRMRKLEMALHLWLFLRERY